MRRCRGGGSGGDVYGILEVSLVAEPEPLEKGRDDGGASRIEAVLQDEAKAYDVYIMVVDGTPLGARK